MKTWSPRMHVPRHMVPRRPVVRLLVGLFCVFLSTRSNPAGRAAEAARPPNIVLILADDLGWGDLGCYGHPKFKTPNLDRMAVEGARLTNFYSTCPYCAPSRASLLTGRYQFRNGVTRNPAPDAGVNDVGLPDSEITLGEKFQAAGYKTICIGKWHLGHTPEFNPIRHGFDEYLGILYSNDMRPVQLIDADKVVEYPVVQATLTRRYTERALEFIRRHQNRPFFIYFPQAMPHKPLAASEAFYKKSGSDLYGDAVAELDWSIGQLLATLKDLELDGRTLVLFTSDNGPWYGGSTGGLRGMKGNCWEGGIREPLIARWPGKIPPALLSHEPAMMPDLFATCLALAGIPAPNDRAIDGKNIFPVLASGAKSPHEAIFSMQGPSLSTVRSGRWKLHIQPPAKPKILDSGSKWIDPRAPDGVTILAPYEQAHPSQYPGALTGDETKAFSLFDLESDPSEQYDVAVKHPDVVERLRGFYEGMNSKLPANQRRGPRREPPRKP
ncbi:MAG: sulfatase [Verrucomicrobia bacterium]|nr:sulfatase [Verrucomicrobiota bacterium]